MNLKGKITALKKVGKSQRVISKALGCSETVISNYLESPNTYGTRKPTGKSENYHHTSKEELLTK